MFISEALSRMTKNQYKYTLGIIFMEIQFCLNFPLFIISTLNYNFSLIFILFIFKKEVIILYPLFKKSRKICSYNWSADISYNH